MDIKNYARARQKGLKAYAQAIHDNQDPYLPVLEEKVPGLNSLNRMSLGIQAIPLSRVVGSVSRGRSFAFANNFMPILEMNSCARAWSRRACGIPPRSWNTWANTTSSRETSASAS